MNNNNNNINVLLEQIISLYDSGGDPNRMMQNMLSQNPNIQQFSTQINNMKQGRSNNEFYLQIARQSGVSQKNIEGISRILGIK